MFKLQPAWNKARYCVTRAWTEVWVRVLIDMASCRRGSNTGIKTRDDIVCINTVRTRAYGVFQIKTPISLEKNNNGQELVQKVHRILKVSHQLVPLAGLATGPSAPGGLEALAVS